MIPAQKFAVGEVVMIRSVSCPEYNTDSTVVVSATYREGVTRTGEVVIGWDYNTCRGCGDPWDESALRKRPPPSTQSFDEIMQELNSPKVPA